MNIQKIAKHFAVTVVFLLNFNILVACLEEDDEENIWKSGETNIILNVSESHLDNQNDIPDSSMEMGGVLEPSLDENFVVSNEKSESIEMTVPDNSTEENIIPNRILLNETPVLLSAASSTVDVEKNPEVSLLFTSHDEMPSPKHTAQTENIPTNISTKLSADEEEIVPEIEIAETAEKNDTAEKSEDIPSFSEWAQKRLEEEVQRSEQINVSLKTPSHNGRGNSSKLRWKNYASLDCGAKVVGSNPETVSPGSILSPAVDEYKLSPCTSRIWFVVELCEAIQAQRIDIANYELFSSSPKEFVVSVSERYPTRDWTLVGKFEAKDERNIQSFDIETQIFGKYIKVEIKSHYGSEHYCPISLFRAYGMSVYEVLQKEDSGNANQADDDDDDDDEEFNLFSARAGEQRNIFSSATDAVISMVKRAAQALGNKADDDGSDRSNASALANSCTSPRHAVVCDGCGDTLFRQVFELLSCRGDAIRRLTALPPIYGALARSGACRRFGLGEGGGRRSGRFDRVDAFFAERYVGAMCNEVAVVERQAVLNVSQHFANVTSNLTREDVVSMDVGVVVGDREVVETIPIEVTEEPANATIPSASADPSQIKPTKTLAVDPNRTSVTAAPDAAPDMGETSESPPPPTAADEEPAEAEIGGEHLEAALDEQMESVESAAVATSAAAASSPQAPKESIFLRLSNRIKALERNVSLSGQYLEELSKRYKKQVEDMQNLSEKTIAVLREETQERLAAARHLQQRLDRLSATVDALAAEKRRLLALVYCLLAVAVACCVLRFHSGRWRVEEAAAVPREKKRRRPSDQVVRIVRNASLTEDDRGRRLKRRKKRASKRSRSAGSVKLEGVDWVAATHRVVEDVPFALDESDHVFMEPPNLPAPQEEHRATQTDASLGNGGEPGKKDKRGLKRFLRRVF